MGANSSRGVWAVVAGRRLPLLSRNGVRILWGLSAVTSLTLPLAAQVGGRTFFKDGSPCVLCRLEVRTDNGSLKLRTDLEGYFDLETGTTDEIKSVRSGRTKSKMTVENGFVFVRLDKMNPQVAPVLKAVRKQLGFVSTSLGSSAEQSVSLADCFLTIESVGYFQGQAQYARAIDVDLTQLDTVGPCPERRNCLLFSLRPDPESGGSGPAERSARVGMTDRAKKQDIPSLVQGIELLARACGNVTVQSDPGFQP